MTTENDILVALAEAREDAAIEATAKALAEGEARGKAEVARAMLAREFTADVIASVTGLTEAQVRTIAQAL